MSSFQNKEVSFSTNEINQKILDDLEIEDEDEDEDNNDILKKEAEYEIEGDDGNLYKSFFSKKKFNSMKLMFIYDLNQFDFNFIELSRQYVNSTDYEFLFLINFLRWSYQEYLESKKINEEKTEMLGEREEDDNEETEEEIKNKKKFILLNVIPQILNRNFLLNTKYHQPYDTTDKVLYQYYNIYRIIKKILKKNDDIIYDENFFNIFDQNNNDEDDDDFSDSEDEVLPNKSISPDPLNSGEDPLLGLAKKLGISVERYKMLYNILQE